MMISNMAAVNRKWERQRQTERVFVYIALIWLHRRKMRYVNSIAVNVVAIATRRMNVTIQFIRIRKPYLFFCFCSFILVFSLTQMQQQYERIDDSPIDCFRLLVFISNRNLIRKIYSFLLSFSRNEKKKQNP